MKHRIPKIPTPRSYENNPTTIWQTQLWGTAVTDNCAHCTKLTLVSVDKRMCQNCAAKAYIEAHKKSEPAVQEITAGTLPANDAPTPAEQPPQLGATETLTNASKDA